MNYTYRISQLEITTSQWMEFLNAFSNVAEPHPYWIGETGGLWGAQLDPNWHGAGEHYIPRNVANAAMLPVGEISWHMAALYCNWLNNGKSSDPASLVSGSYDTTTWGYRLGTIYFTDAFTHESGAKYWIPTLDEWLKASFYDPNKNGVAKGGWWMYPNSSDTPSVPGFPGAGTTSALVGTGVSLIGWTIPLGAYADTVSPWGLFDVSGGTREWLEEVPSPGFPTTRWQSGSYAGGPMQGGLGYLDNVYHETSGPPESAGLVNGFRIASSVPTPGSWGLCFAAFGVFVANSRRRLT